MYVDTLAKTGAPPSFVPFLECFEFKTALPTPLGLTFFFLWFRHLLSFPVRQKRPRFSGKARVTSRHPPHRPRTRKPLAFSRNRSVLQVADNSLHSTRRDDNNDSAAKLPPTLGPFRTRSNPTLAQP